MIVSLKCSINHGSCLIRNLLYVTIACRIKLKCLSCYSSSFASGPSLAFQSHLSHSPLKNLYATLTELFVCCSVILHAFVHALNYLSMTYLNIFTQSEVRTQQEDDCLPTHTGALTRTWHLWYPDLGLPASRKVRKCNLSHIIESRNLRYFVLAAW